MENKGHTPGPWAYDPDGGEIYHPNGQFENALAAVYDLADAAEQDANARLIAAAPDLLEALTKLRAVFHDGILNSDGAVVSDAIESMCAAIQRATEGGA
jgi:hypothetical protein